MEFLEGAEDTYMFDPDREEEVLTRAELKAIEAENFKNAETPVEC